jgi:predicted ATPase
VLDNCEQLLPDAAMVVGELLETCPDLAIVATSREPLRLRRERRLPVRSLAVPDSARPLDAAKAAQSPAVALFVERAQAVDPAFVLRDDNARCIAELCARLDGLPLAIELVAARLDILPLEAMVKWTDQPLALLNWGVRDGPVRQRTLRDLIDWSYDLLSEADKTVFSHLAVFTGDWTIDAAEAICASSPPDAQPLIDVISSLVDKSLVQMSDSDHNGEPRFRI